MFDIAPSEFMLVAFVALVVIGPKDLPKAMRVVGYWVGKARGVARQFRSGFDEMVREAELAEMEKKWAAENERIMREHPAGGLSEASASDNLATAGSEAAPAASSDGVAHGDTVPAASSDGVAHDAAPAAIPHDDPAPVHVEQPTVEPAPAGTPGQRGDGVTS